MKKINVHNSYAIIISSYNLHITSICFLCTLNVPTRCRFVDRIRRINWLDATSDSINLTLFINIVIEDRKLIGIVSMIDDIYVILFEELGIPMVLFAMSFYNAFKEDLKKVEQLHVWTRQVFSLGGMWPLDRTFVKFYIGFAYSTFHLVLALSDLINVFGDLTLTIMNLLESTVQIMVAVKIMVFRHSTLLARVVQQVQSGSDPARYKDQEEKNLYLAYNAIGRMFFIGGHYLAVITCLSSYFRPFEEISKSVLSNETFPFVLPFRIRLFFNVTDIRTYALIYLTQGPMMYYYYLHAISICFLCTLIVHVAGDLSILAYRIRRIDWCNLSNNSVDPKLAFHELVAQHHNIIWVATAIDRVFNAILLEELVITTGLMALTFYNALAKSDIVSMVEYIYILNYCTALIIVILVYCITGEYLIRESANVHDAYYECHWYGMKAEYLKYLTISMCRTQRPLQLTAGRFYVFSLPRFSDIIKSSMAYVSMLRTMA